MYMYVCRETRRGMFAENEKGERGVMGKIKNKNLIIARLN